MYIYISFFGFDDLMKHFHNNKTIYIFTVRSFHILSGNMMCTWIFWEFYARFIMNHRSNCLFSQWKSIVSHFSNGPTLGCLLHYSANWRIHMKLHSFSHPNILIASASASKLDTANSYCFHSGYFSLVSFQCLSKRPQFLGTYLVSKHRKFLFMHFHHYVHYHTIWVYKYTSIFLFYRNYRYFL